jgi:CDP-glucose 4,6-dehydratase
VDGFGLSPPTTPNHWDLLRLGIGDHRGDVCDAAAVRAAVDACRPEIVFHLAAQSLVRRSYRNPLESWSANVMGTANVLDACRSAKTVRAIVVVTTDKVYANCERAWGYKENDPLGGHDPYSASKAAAELVVESYRKAFFAGNSDALVATARAGNVIGGGDWSEDRLIPDVVRSIGHNEPVEIRFPNATRSWQHVLECLAGYLILGEQLLSARRECAEAWNFGPNPEDQHTVSAVLRKLQEYWPEIRWQHVPMDQPHEAGLLHLDTSKTRSFLGWQPVWSLGCALSATAQWYRQFAMSGKTLTHEQILSYVEAAKRSGCSWAA